MSADKKDPIEQLLARTAVPTFSNDRHKSTLKTLFIQSAKNTNIRSRRQAYLFWHRGRWATSLAAVGLFLLIGGGTVIAQAGNAKPGDPLYSLDRGLERARLYFADTDLSKLDLKIGFAEERIDEMVVVTREQTPYVGVAIQEAETALNDIDQDFDNARLSLEFGDGVVRLTSDQLNELTTKFRDLLRRRQNDITTISVASADLENTPYFEEMNDIIDNELSENQSSVTEGYLVELRGEVQPDGSLATVGGRNLQVEGIDTSAFVGRTLKIEGVVKTGILTAHELKFGSLKVERVQDEVYVTASGLIHTDDTASYLQYEGIQFELSGPLLLDKSFAELEGLQATVTGFMTNQSVLVAGVKATDSDGVVTLLGDARTSTSPESTTDAEEATSDNQSTPEASTPKPTTTQVQPIEVTGTLVQAEGMYKITQNGTTYTLQPNSSLEALVGKRVRVKGQPISAGSLTLSVTEAKAAN